MGAPSLGKASYTVSMRRLLTFAAFLLMISVVPVCAQRGDGHGSSGGGHSSFSGGGHSFSGGSHASFAGRSGFVSHASGAVSGQHFASHYASGARAYSRAYRNRGVVGAYGYRNRCYGCLGYGYPYYGYYAGIDPYWWWDSNSDNQEDADQRAMANDMSAENLDEQQQLRQEDQDANARPMNRPRGPAPAVAQSSIEPATVLVYRDQHQREIQNYAIVGSTLWAFTPQRTEKISLAELDLPATTKANEDRGVDFRLPRSSEGQ